MNRLLILIIFLLNITSIHASQEVYSVRKNSQDLSIGIIEPMLIEDGHFYELGNGSFADKSKVLYLKFGVDEREGYGQIQGYVALTANVIITPMDINGAISGASFSQQLLIDYSPNGNVGNKIHTSLITDNSAYKYKIEVTNITLPPGLTTVPENIYLEAELHIERYYDLNLNPPTIGANAVTYDINTGSEVKNGTSTGVLIPNTVQELEVFWDYIEGAEEYELEWTWIDNYSVTAGVQFAPNAIQFNERAFELNNTRIITNKQSFRIPLIYAKGFLIYRVRAIGRWLDGADNFKKMKFGSWSSDISSSITTISTWPNYVQLEEHEKGKNWQFQAVYAEEGKKKEIVSYFDGSLRNRQTVTKINSNNEAIVGENVYDNQGRSAIQILPTPVNNPAIRYYPGLNKNMANTPYSHWDFDWDNLTASECVANVEAMETTSGASKYYSSNNAVENNWQDQVPNANGFPFVQVEYTPDNTGRIRRQSGVGDTYTIDGTHATQYFYLQPYQEELNRLFGYQVGHKTRYKKNLVVDANGQVSVSYIDPQGRVVATALAGDNNTNLQSLSEEQTGNHSPVNVDLLNKYGVNDTDTGIDDNQLFNSGNIGAYNDALNLNTQQAPTDNGSAYNYNYQLRTGTFSDPCTPFTYPFAYVLDIDIRDDCGQSVIGDITKTNNIDNTSVTIPAGALHETFDQVNADYSYAFTGVLDIESYTVNKNLAVDPDRLDYYAQNYITNNTCLLTLDDFLENNVDCSDTLPESFYQDINNCTVSHQMMLADLSPNGQYGSSDGTDLLSVFSSANVLAQGTLTNNTNWKYPTTPYADQNGNPVWIEVTTTNGGAYVPAVDNNLNVQVINGNTYIAPEHLANADDFIGYFQPSWAESLLEYHPEYCYVAPTDELCTVQDNNGFTSESFNATLQEITTYAEAIDVNNAFGTNLLNNLFGLDPFFSTNTTYNFMDLDGTAVENEELFASGLMNEINTNYKGTGMSIWEFALQTVICGTNLSGNCQILPAYLTGDLTGLSVSQQDQVWNIYKQTYIGEKKKIIQVFIDCNTIATNCYNGYIGEETPTQPSISGFLYYPNYTTQNFLDVITGTDGPSMSILEFYYEAQQTAIAASTNLSNLYPWTNNQFAFLFQDKEKRFIPIDNLYDSTVPEDVMIEQQSEVVDANVYEQTGRCDLSFDVEYLLDALAQQNVLSTSATSILSDNVPQLTQDLYIAMGGTVMTSGSGSTNVNITSTPVGTGLQITANDAMVPGSSMLSINLNPVLFNWNNVVGMNTLYYVPNSLANTGTYQFKIIALVENTPGVITEEIVTGYTAVEIGECTYQEPCPKAENFGDDLGALFNQLYANDNFITNPYNNQSLQTILGAWYEDSELQTQLQDFNTVATLTTTASDFTIIANNYTLNYSFTMPSDILQITGFTFNQTTLTSTIYYITTAGLSSQFTANVTYQNNGQLALLNFNCGCESETQFSVLYQNMLTELLDIYTVTPNNLNGGYSSDNISALNTYVTFDYTQNPTGNVEIHNFNLSGDQLTFSHEKQGSCAITFTEINNINVTTLTTIFSVNVSSDLQGDILSMTIIGSLADGTIVTLTSSRPCYKIPPCGDCIPTTVEPVSCNEKFTLYDNAISAYNSVISSPLNLFPTYTVDEFCATHLAYATDAYLYYLTTFSITDNSHPQYLTINQFANTNLNLGFQDINNGITMTSVVDSYQAFLVNNPNVIWNDYVNNIYFETITTCPPVVMPTPIDITVDIPCEQLTANIDTVNAQNQYGIYIENVLENFKQSYVEEAISSVIENFEVNYNDKEYHYTLYYYDQAGNLVQTVPPAGVDRIDQTINNTVVNGIRGTNTPPSIIDNTVLPDHQLETNYKYNSLNQLVWQSTPDGGESYFGYDKLGRLVVSQNAKQLGDNQISYTKYDEIGRIIEVGELTLGTTGYGFNQNGRFIDGTGNEVDVNNATFPDTISTVKEEVTVTIYDENPFLNIISQFEDFSIDNTRNRIMGVLYFETYGASNTYSGYDNATFYDYDVHGNVKELIQDIKDQDLQLANLYESNGTTAVTSLTKKTKYDYDLVSGNVKEVAYQNGKEDQFVHQYCYDADNRITNVLTSKDRVLWEQDAKYFYYDHGPLARSEIGDQKVQSCDYAYTIQGWLKGVNSEDLQTGNDQGRDANYGHTNQMNAKDVMGYSLHYYDNDYQNRSGNNEFLAYSALPTAPVTPTSNLFNGNIKQMYTASTNTNEQYIGTSHTWYAYDQLNRIKSMNQETLEHGQSPTNTQEYYKSDYTYDKNGNLQTLNRWAKSETAPGSGVYQMAQIDQFQYAYNANTNQLNYVNDLMGASVMGTDLASQSAGNYAYDAIGQLISDQQEDLATIEWKVTGKVDKITKANGDIIDFVYDAMGNRIVKKDIPSDGVGETHTYYVRDAQGNVMSIYKYNPNQNGVGGLANNLYLYERNIYGSSRIGMEQVQQVIATSAPNQTNWVNSENQNTNPHAWFNQKIGDKRFELANHLGNVLEVITDRKVRTVFADSQLDLSSVSTVSLCSSGGNWLTETSNGSFPTSLTPTDYNNDGVSDLDINNAGAYFSGMVSMETTPGESYTVTYEVLDKTVNTVSVAAYTCQTTTSTLLSSSNITTTGQHTITFVAQSPVSRVKWLGYSVTGGSIVLSNVSLKGTAASFGNANNGELVCYSPDVISQNDYYPFGMLLPNRHDPGDGYRYGFNGMEKIDEIDGVEGSKLDFGNRIYDSRIGRWLSLDGLASEYPHQSDYVYVSNSPIGKIDIDGDWDIEVHAYKNRKKYGYAILIVKDRMGNEVYRTTVRVQGNKSKIGKSRALKMGDTPTGTYNLVEWRATGNDRYSRAVYGPNDLLATDYKSGEGKAAGRNGMHIHGGRQEGDDYMKYGKLLWNTSGCMRIKDSELKEIQNITQRLEENDSEESPGILTVTNDLVDENGKYVIPGDNAGILQNVEPVNSTPKTAVDNTDETIDATLKELDEMDGVIRDGLENIENMQNEMREMMQEADDILENNNIEDSAPKKKKIKQAVVIDGAAPKKKKIKQAVVIDGSSGN